MTGHPVEPWDRREEREDERDELDARLDARDRQLEHAGLRDDGWLPDEPRGAER